MLEDEPVELKPDIVQKHLTKVFKNFKYFKIFEIFIKSKLEIKFRLNNETKLIFKWAKVEEQQNFEQQFFSSS